MIFTFHFVYIPYILWKHLPAALPVLFTIAL